ncbi:MAG: hypothetical protein QM754_02075 [Tepidisphaeraceae bacterium]
MSQVTANTPVSTATPAAASPKPVVDYTVRPPARKSSWLNARVIIFVLFFGAIFGIPAYMGLKEYFTQGVSQRADGSFEVDLKAMSLFPLDQQNGRTEDVPERFRALDGKKVSLVGEMWAPNASSDRVGSFDLVYSIAKCCFSGPPQVQHFVKSTPTKAGTGMPFYSGLVRVTGTLTVDVQRDADKVSSVYRLSVDSVDPI